MENTESVFHFSDTPGLPLLSVENKQTGANIQTDETSGNLWCLHLWINGRDCPFFPQTQPETSIDANGVLTAVWQENFAGFHVIANATITLKPGTGIADWAISVQVEGKNAPLIFAVDYPVISKIRPIGDDALVLPHTFGKILKNPCHQTFSPWPTYPGWWSGQFIAYAGNPDAENESYPVPENRYVDAFFRGDSPRETGLFYSADDKDGTRKNMLLSGNAGNDFFQMGMKHFPQWPDNWKETEAGRQATSYKMPYSVRLGIYSGGIDAGIDIYRAQVADYPFLDNGPLKGKGCTGWLSDKIAVNPIFSNNWCIPNELPKRIKLLQDFYGIPVILHHYAYWQNYFDFNYPDYTPVAGGYRQANRIARHFGLGIMPYVNSIRADMRSRAFKQFNLKDDAVFLRDGAPLAAPMEGNPFIVMTHGEKWTAMLNRLLHYLVGGEEASGFYLDEGGQSSHCLYNPGMPQHGGRAYSDNYLKMVRQLRKTAQQFTDSPFFSTECCNENYIGCIDSFLLYTLKGAGGDGYIDKNLDHYPVFTRVYHEYATSHAIPINGATPDAVNHLSIALGFVWGQQLHAMEPTEANFALPAALFSRNLSRAAYQVAGDYLLGGRMESMALACTEDQIGNSPLALVSSPCIIKEWPGSAWHGPTILGSAWKSRIDHSLGMVFAPSQASPSKGLLVIDGSSADIESSGNEVWRLWPLPMKKIAELQGSHNRLPLVLPENDCLVLAIRKGAPEAPVPLTNREDKIVLADSNGEFSPETFQSGAVFMGEFHSVENRLNGNGNMVVVEKNHELAFQPTVLEWGPVSNEMPFDRIYPTALKLSGAQSTLSIKGSGRIGFGTLTITEEPEKIEIDDKCSVIFTQDGTNYSDTPTIGEWRFLIAPTDMLENPLSPEKVVAEWAGHLPSATEKEKLEEWCALANGQSFLKTGKDRIPVLTDHWLLPEIPRSFDCQILRLRQDTNMLVQEKNTLIATEEGIGTWQPILMKQTENDDSWYLLADFEIAEPIMIDLPSASRMLEPDKDGKYRTCIRIRNRSKTPLKLNLASVNSSDWSFSKEENCLAFSIPAFTEIYHPIVVETNTGIPLNLKIQTIIVFHSNAPFRQKTLSSSFILAEAENTCSTILSWSKSCSGRNLY